MNFTIPVSRRDFFKLAGLTTAGIILSDSTENKKVSAAENINFNDKNIP